MLQSKKAEATTGAAYQPLTPAPKPAVLTTSVPEDDSETSLAAVRLSPPEACVGAMLEILRLMGINTEYLKYISGPQLQAELQGLELLAREASLTSNNTKLADHVRECETRLGLESKAPAKYSLSNNAVVLASLDHYKEVRNDCEKWLSGQQVDWVKVQSVSHIPQGIETDIATRAAVRAAAESRATQAFNHEQAETVGLSATGIVANAGNEAVAHIAPGGGFTRGANQARQRRNDAARECYSTVSFIRSKFNSQAV